MNNTLDSASQPDTAPGSVAEMKPKLSRFDVFKGAPDETGKIRKLKSVGAAFRHPNGKTYTLYLRTFIKDVFYLLPETRDLSRGDFGIMTRIPSRIPNRHFMWNNVGQGFALKGDNGGLIHLLWDLFGANDLYLALRTDPDPRYPRAVL